MTRTTVLVAEDDDDIRLLTRTIVERAGFDVVEAADGQEALRSFYERRPDVVLLDVSMPRLDGWGALERIRELSDVPVLMLTALASEIDKVRGLRSGADDYLTKPFSGPELLARIEALLRRPRSGAEEPEIIDDGVVSVDLGQRTVSVDGREVAVTPLEFKLMAAFARNRNQVLSHEQLLGLVWGDAYDASRDQLKIYVGYLRKKLAAAGIEDAIDTVRGFGYRYVSQT